MSIATERIYGGNPLKASVLSKPSTGNESTIECNDYEMNR